MSDTYITVQTPLGWLAGKIVDEDEEKYLIEFGGGKQYEVLKEEIFVDDGNMYVIWW